MRRKYYPPLNTQPANIRADGLPASMPELICAECGRPSITKICACCKGSRKGNRERHNRQRQAEYLAALAVWNNEGGAIPVDPGLTLKQRGLKRCSACGAELPLGWFRKRGARCRACRRPQKSKDNAARRQRMYFGRALPDKVPQRVIDLLQARQGGFCACGCGGTVLYRYHLDHRISIKRGGRHVLSNLQLLTPECNLRKGAR